MLPAPPATSTSAPGCCSSCGPTVRQASGMLSEALAAAATSTFSGSGNSIASAYGARTASARNPPQSPPIVRPYIAIGGVASQDAVRPCRHAAQSPQKIWNEIVTCWPGSRPSTLSPTSTTSATPSCPSANGPRYGLRPCMSTPSRSQVAGRDRQRADDRLAVALERRCRHVAPFDLAWFEVCELLHHA